MAKKRKKTSRRKSSRRPRGWRTSRAQIADWLHLAGAQVVKGDSEGAIKTAQRVLRYVPAGSPPYAEAHERLGAAYGLMQQFDAAYDSCTRALEAAPGNAYLWYNRGITARYVSQFGQSMRDLEQAVALETKPSLREQYQEALAVSRKMAQSELELRGPGFSLEQLIEQQALMRQAVRLMEAGDWAGAEATLRRVIEMADVLPQPQGNLAGCLIQQQRYDEAETALRRALEIDPGYEMARQNLENLPYMRKYGASGFEVSRPYDGVKIKKGLTILKE